MQHEARAGIGKIAVLLRRDVNIHQLSSAQDFASRNAMGDCGKHADAGGAGKVVGQLRSRTRAFQFEQLRADGVEFSGGHAGLRSAAHGFKRAAHDQADPFQPVELVFAINGHAAG